jgi:2-dehydro-3-deoxyphosphogalactonate aldolase
MIDLQRFAPPLVAILRGLEPERAADVAQVLFAAGFRIVEVPLNRPGAIEAIATIARDAPDDALVGGGTMLTVDDVDAVHAAGGRLMVAPNCEPAVINRAAALGMVTAPGVATPTEAFAALAAGAHGLKLFPAELITPAVLKALCAVLPRGVPLLPVGGISPANMAIYRAAGATGFGIGSALYAPGKAAETVRATARQFVAAHAASMPA